MKIKLLVLLTLFLLNNVIAQKATDSVYQSKMYSLYAKAYNYVYSNKDSAYHYFNKINIEAIKQNDFEALVTSLNAYNKSAAHFNDLEIMKANFKKLDSIVLKNKTKLQETGNALFYSNSINLDKGIYYFTLNDYNSSRVAFENIIHTTKALHDEDLNTYHIDLLTSAYSFVAKTYVNDGKYDLAKDYYKESIQILEQKKPDDIKRINRIYSLLAEVLKNQKQYRLSNSYFKKSLEFNLLHNGNSSSIITEANHLLENYLVTYKIDSSTYYLKIIKDHLTQNHPRQYVFHEAKSKILQAENNYLEAEKELQTALQLVKQKWQNQPHNTIAEAYNNLGLLHAKFNKPEKALENYNLALQQFSTNKNPSTINQTTVLRILKNKAKALNIVEKASESIQTVNQALQTLDALKPSFQNNTDKLFLMEEAFPVFESGLEATYHLYQKTKQDSLIDKAFFYSEKSKSALLLEALLSTKATTFANIPIDITEKEQLLKSKINHIEKQLNRSRNNKLEDELFQLKNNYRNLITTIETNYKSYYNLKYNTQVISVAETQKLLQAQDVLLSYFYGNHAIYTIAITKNTKTIKQYKTDTTLENEIIAIYQMLNNPKSDLKTLHTKTYHLYKKLVAPSLANLQQKNLIIIADGLLNYIPFSSLNTNRDSTNYIIENYATCYANSATLLKQLLEKKEANNKVLAFAPSFNTASSNLLALPNNIAEATDILHYFKGKTLTSSQATLENFNTESSKYGILHFATHAILNDKTPEYSYLAFQPNKENNNLLYVSDLYNLNLNTNLVTLSACESGIGNLKRGEGFMSLARGFYFSGASSISSTLWKINDASALNIMDAFYKNLSKKETKNVALQNAQVEFIHTNKENALVHPYYWSGFVISGNTNALVTGSNFIWYLLGAATFIIIALAYKKRRKFN
ncbi:CHAT domain-containing protein [Lacinutrix sp. C3R15]|uniref:CHAT domain-containing protein n=1 Tax=Flavobacteriaceae TaxID=49546 RepID=UPI001C087C3A|nr:MULTISPECIES: CHAT domain-containing tetratricopeptide repeat protein [Flavobacteriaceae]MBU2939427.1 CHAT domain-containing protein [Lacinutrix sp. C3R15]MDO6622742.1 CHAT domain-containing protein [Oceanihabitans sp. 1_MG-2023]